MRVLHITTNYPTPDRPIFGIFVKEQVDSLREIGVDCDVIYCDRKGRSAWYYLTYVPRIWWVILKGHYDIIHCHHVLSSILCLLTLWPLFKTCVLSYQNDPAKEGHINCFGLIHLFFRKIIIKNISPYLSKSKTVYLPNGCNEHFFTPMDRNECRDTLGLDRESIYVLYMDSNSKSRTQKRKDRFDATIELLRSDYPNIRSIELYNTPREMIPTYINACDLHLMTSDFEGSPNSVKECLCCNTPVVSTNVGNVSEMLDGINGCIVVDSFTPEALAEAVKRVLEMPESFDGRPQFLAKGYSITAVAMKLKALYQDLC